MGTAWARRCGYAERLRFDGFISEIRLSVLPNRRRLVKQFFPAQAITFLRAGPWLAAYFTQAFAARMATPLALAPAKLCQKKLPRSSSEAIILELPQRTGTHLPMSFLPNHSPASTKPGPLTGTTIIELAAIGPVPFATHCMQQMGAQIIVVNSPVDRGLGLPLAADVDYLASGKQHVTIDLKADDGPARLLDLLRQADVLIEGFRPGTLERLLLSPAVIHAAFPSLVIARGSGWGSQSERAATAGHDINYLALSGALAAIGPAGKPIPPLNLIGDFGGAGMHLVTGILAALLSRSKDGKGTVVETSIYQGTTALMTMLYGLADAGQWRPEREANVLDGGAPYYCCYQTSDARWMAVGAIERKFFTAFVRQIGADELDLERQNDRSYWPEMHRLIANKIHQRSQHEWDLIFRKSDCCCTPVLTMDEARTHETTLSMFNGPVPNAPIAFSDRTDPANES